MYRVVKIIIKTYWSNLVCTRYSHIVKRLENQIILYVIWAFESCDLKCYVKSSLVMLPKYEEIRKIRKKNSIDFNFSCYVCLNFLSPSFYIQNVNKQREVKVLKIATKSVTSTLYMYLYPQHHAILWFKSLYTVLFIIPKGQQ